MVLQTTAFLRHFKLLIEHCLPSAAPTPPHTHTFSTMVHKNGIKGEREREKKKEKKTFVLLESLKAPQQKPGFHVPAAASCEITQPPMHTKTPGVSTCTAPTATPILKAASVSRNFWGRIDPVNTMTISLRRGSLAKKLPVSIIVSVPCVTTTRFVATSSDSTRASSARSSSVISVESFVHAVWYSTCMPSGT